MDFIDAHGVGDDLDKTTVRASSEDFVRLQPERQLFDSEYLVDLGN